METKRFIDENKLVVIMRGLNKDEALLCAKAMHKGGIRLIEVTFNQTKSPEVTGEIISALCKEFPDMCIGAGTVVTEEQLLCAHKSGAKYIISPNTNIEIIKKTKELSLVSMPGALTPSEIVTASEAGADYVKIFPVSSMQKNYIKSISAPLNHIKLIAVGGVTHENLAEFMHEGAVGVGVGGNIVNKQLIVDGKFEEITALAKQYVSAVNNA